MALLIFVSFLAGLSLTWCARLAARTLDIVNHPNKIVPQHTQPIAYLGGIGIFGGVAVTIAIGRMGGLLAPSYPGEILSFWLPSLAFLLLGLFDDLRPLKPLPKFGLQAAAAGLAVYGGNIWLFTDSAWLDYGISFLVLIFAVNAFNFTDVCDGLLSGLAIITLVCAAFLFPEKQHLALVMAAACLGFLCWNRPPATIFLGDAGSHLLAFWCVYLLIRPWSGWEGGVQNILILGVPIFEAVFITCVRLDKGLAWWKGSPDHFSLRLQSMGLSKYQTNLSAWCVALALATAAIVLPGVDAGMQTGLLTLVGIFLVAVWKGLRRADKV
jgi:UDP-GlcNAc:undecaprenyl-phosphate/decaprenyl-phosphate GlcNAc-1-phosphate transferase